MRMRVGSNAMIGAFAISAMLGAAAPAQAQTQLKVMVFPGLSNFSIFAASTRTCSPSTASRSSF